MDISTIIGLLLGFGAIVVSVILEEGNPLSFFIVSAMLIVFGGTIGATMVSFPMNNIMGLPKAISQAFKQEAMQARELVELFVTLAERARKEGILSLESEAETISDDFIKKGLMLVVDGTDPEVVRSVLETDVAGTQHRH